MLLAVLWQLLHPLCRIRTGDCSTGCAAGSGLVCSVLPIAGKSIYARGLGI